MVRRCIGSVLKQFEIDCCLSLAVYIIQAKNFSIYHPRQGLEIPVFIRDFTLVV